MHQEDLCSVKQWRNFSGTVFVPVRVSLHDGQGSGRPSKYICLNIANFITFAGAKVWKQGNYVLNRMAAPSAAVQAIASNPGVSIVPDGAVAGAAVGTGDVTGKDADGPVFPEERSGAGVVVFIPVDVAVGGKTYWNIVSGPGDPPVPIAPVTEIGTDPGWDGGVMIVSLLSLTIFRPVPDLPPNWTSFAPENPDPVTVTIVPPSVDPEEGEMLFSVGRGNS
jgi:hypothetical protein